MALRGVCLLVLTLAGSSLAQEGKVEARLVEGKFGKALDASVTPQAYGGDERYRTPPLTIECWARLNNHRPFNVLVSCDPKSSARHWEIYSYMRTGHFAAYFPGYEPSEIVSRKNICDQKWHYLAATFDGKVVRLYVDGQLVREQAIKPRAGLKSRDGPLSIGQAIEGEQRVGCDGVIDEVRLSRVLRDVRRVPLEPLKVDRDTIALWQFDGSDRVLADPAWTPPPNSTGEPWERMTDADWVDPRLRNMDTGPTFNGTMAYQHNGQRELVYKGTAIRLGEKGEGAVLFDRGTLRLAAGWTGGYLNHSDRRFGLLNTPTPAGKMLFSTASGPGVADPQGKTTSKHPATLPLPRDWGHFEGLHLHGQRVVLAYTVQGVRLRESPWLEKLAGESVIVRTLEVAPSRTELRLLVGELPGKISITGLTAQTAQGETQQAIRVSEVDGKLIPEGQRLWLSLPASSRSRQFEVALWSGARSAWPGLAKALTGRATPSLQALLKPGPGRYPHALVTRGELGKTEASYAVDTLTIPYDNPHRALFFCTGLDFLPDGRVAVCTCHGDVWLVKYDEKLEKIAWRRFATGLYQPLGLRVVDGRVVLLERGQLTRLHDLNHDGEADFYENLCNQWHTGPGEHSFDTCLETDSQGNFYFFKTGDTNLPHGGCLLRVSKDGQKVDIFATGFRHPIGLSIGPGDVVTGADQEGNWMPSTRLDIYRQGGFYGDLRAHHRQQAPASYDPPLCWLPKEIDNSAGGQVWVPHDRFGLPRGQMLHLSYGRCKLYAVLTQKVGELWQGGVVDLGVQFLSGSARGRFHPRDGHLYVCGLNGWQTAAKKDGCLQRVRFTGQALPMPTSLAFTRDGIRLGFARKLDARQASSRDSYRVEQWNYRWTANYGSPRYSVKNPEHVGRDVLQVQSAHLGEDGRSVLLKVKDLGPAMQVRIGYELADTSGKPLRGQVHGTIHRLANDK